MDKRFKPDVGMEVLFCMSGKENADLVFRDKTPAKVLKRLSEGVDVSDGISMFEIEFSDGFKAEAFEDELHFLVTDEIKGKVYNKFGGTCAYCWEPISGDEMEIDYLIPLNEGGSEGFENLMPSCPLCKRTKNGENLDSFEMRLSNYFPELARRDEMYRVIERLFFDEGTTPESLCKDKGYINFQATELYDCGACVWGEHIDRDYSICKNKQSEFFNQKVELFDNCPEIKTWADLAREHSYSNECED